MARTTIRAPQPADRAVVPVIVFLGPSLPLSEARCLLAADYRPPLRRGDLDAIAAPAVVGVVDGVLEPETRLAAAEARRAAERGVCLFGAASVGALLAADPSIPGAVHGVGDVFRLLRLGRARAEDVSVLYAAHDLRPLTVPAVDVLCWLDNAISSGSISAPSAAAAMCALRALPVDERTPATVAHLLRDRLASAAPGAGHPSVRSVKAADAGRLLRLLRALLDGRGMPAGPDTPPVTR